MDEYMYEWMEEVFPRGTGEEMRCFPADRECDRKEQVGSPPVADLRPGRGDSTDGGCAFYPGGSWQVGNRTDFHAVQEGTIGIVAAGHMRAGAGNPCTQGRLTVLWVLHRGAQIAGDKRVTGSYCGFNVYMAVAYTHLCMARKAAKAGGSKKRTVSGKRGKPGRKKQRGVDPRGVAGIVIPVSYTHLDVYKRQAMYRT